MAERRMFAKSVVDSDAFLDMPVSTQCLYFHLGLSADDDGFAGNPKRILRTVGASEDDLKVLIAKNFVIPFESGVCVITHWKTHNCIQKDRYKPTMYLTERQSVGFEGGKYTTCIQNVSKTYPQTRLEKENIVKESYFKKPTVKEIEDYCSKRSNGINASNFFDYYEARGWMVGKNKMKDWQAAIRTWERRENDNASDELTRAILEE